VDSEFTLADTGGCTCAQIIELLPGKKKGHEKHGCPKGIMKKWIQCEVQGGVATDGADVGIECGEE